MCAVVLAFGVTIVLKIQEIAMLKCKVFDIFSCNLVF
jgi:hypothetical protein